MVPISVGWKKHVQNSLSLQAIYVSLFVSLSAPPRDAVDTEEAWVPSTAGSIGSIKKYLHSCLENR
jgi:hypothetical protein